MPLILLFICFLHDLVNAAPTTHEGGLGRRDHNDSSGLKPQIWAPILIVALLVAIIAVMTWSKKGFPRWSSIAEAAAVGAGAFSASHGAVQTRELTADQLTGNTSNNSNNSSNNENSNGNNRTRRTRRPRRTPSQISTTSLPAYMKEPGEQELVIFRGPADMEDVPINSVTAAVEMPTVDEDGDSENSVRERYTPMPDSPHDMPLLHPDESGETFDRSTTALVPPVNDQGRRSVETVNYNSDESSLMRIDTTVTTDGSPDPRGAAPAYFEVVDLSEVPTPAASRITNGTATTDNTQQPQETQLEDNENQSPTGHSRRSTFRFSNIFGRNSSHRASQSHSSVSQPPVPPPPGIPISNNTNATVTFGHTRTGSAGGLSLTSTVSRSTQASPANRSRSRMSNYHRPSQSSSSLLSLVNPLSRKKSTTTLNSINNLTSPSLISLQSISAPLSHTLVKTEFTYPKSGPTPEQMKLISSRENLAGRFGLPYGAEAVRWARSRTELMDDSVPPPGFEEISGLPPLSSAGPSRLGASASGGTSSSSGSNNESRSSNSTDWTSPSSVDTDVGGRDVGTSGTGTPLISAPAPPVIRVDAASKPPTPRLPSLSPSAVGEASNAAAATSSPALSSPTPSGSSPNPASIPIPESPPTSPTSTINANAQFRSLPPSETQSVPSKTNKDKAPPPSAFRAEFNINDDLFYSRAESRASSFRSFATANESLSEFGERTGARKGTVNNLTSNTMRSETPALSIAESRYYSGDDDDEGDHYNIRGTTRGRDDSDSGGETETEFEDERRDRRLTVRA